MCVCVCVCGVHVHVRVRVGMSVYMHACGGKSVLIADNSPFWLMVVVLRGEEYGDEVNLSLNTTIKKHTKNY